MSRKKKQSIEETEEQVEENIDNEESLEESEVSEVFENIKLEDSDEPDEQSDDLFKDFNQFLKKRANIEKEFKIQELIPTGIQVLDTILGGGFPIGPLCVLVGQAGSGKSMLAYQTLAQAQKKYKNMLCGVLDSEESTTKERLAMLGVTNPQITPYREVTLEKVFKFIEGLCTFKNDRNITETPSMVIWDSIANTISQKELEIEDLNATIGYRSRLMSFLLPKYISKCTKNNVCFLAINQLRENIQIGTVRPVKELRFLSQNKRMFGGATLYFNAFTLVELRIKTILERDKYGFDGISVMAKCVKNKLFSPNIEVELIGSFVSGFSNFWSNFNFLVLNKRIVTGAWNYLLEFPNKKFRTKDVENLYKEDLEFRDGFDRVVNETLKTEIIDKHSIN